MTTDQLTAEQKAGSEMVPGVLGQPRLGLRRLGRHPARRPDRAVGKYGWDGGMGTTWSSDPAEEMVTILMTGAMWTSPIAARGSCRDFRTSAYGAIDD